MLELSRENATVGKNGLMFWAGGRGRALPEPLEDPYPSLSDFHDYEPNLEFDDSELHSGAIVTGE